MQCNFFQWIDGPDMYDRAFIEQKYMYNYAKQTEVFSKRLEDLRLHINERLKARGIEPFRFNQRRQILF